MRQQSRPVRGVRTAAALVLCLLISACKVEVVVPEGGAVAQISRHRFVCDAGQTCQIDIRDAVFNDYFAADPRPGWKFDGWAKGDRHLFGGSRENPIRLSTWGFAGTGLMDILRSEQVFYLRPKFVRESENDNTVAAWSLENSKLWTGDQLEGRTPYCDKGTIRWNQAIMGFDVNGDEVTEIILPISCYQEWLVDVPEIHNTQVIAAWRMFCSDPARGHYDCTRERFGTREINATGTQSGGGNPYTHIMHPPRDINGDGYPDIWYALNRDDGRPLPDLGNPAESSLVDKYCPNPESEWTRDCTRASTQSLLLSRADGSYRVVFAPWSPLNAMSMIVLPNTIGTFDVVSLNYGPAKAARFREGRLVDVTQEYRRHFNLEAFSSPGTGPYAQHFEYKNRHYVAVSGVSPSVVGYPASSYPSVATDNYAFGFMLWEWIPGAGFQLSDYYLPPRQHLFTYRFAEGAEAVTRTGVYVRGVPSFRGAYHFFRFVQLHPDEEPVLIVTQEAPSTVGDYFKAEIDPEVPYRYHVPWGEDTRHFLGPLSPTEGFYVRDGKLEKRARAVVNINAFWDTTYSFFTDINGDGYTDMYGVSGGTPSGSVYLNDGQGTLRRLSLTEHWPEPQPSDDYTGGHGGQPWHLDGDDKLDFISWGEGLLYQPEPPWAKPGYSYAPPDMRIYKGVKPVSAFKTYSIKQLMKEIQMCGPADFSAKECSSL